jgi:hypothetical protein
MHAERRLWSCGAAAGAGHMEEENNPCVIYVEVACNVEW